MTNASRKALTSIVSFLLVASLAWAADAPWKGKPYQQWDDKDIQRVYTDSPWARRATITRSWTALSQKDLPNPQLGGGSAGGGRGMSSPGGAGGGGDQSASELTFDVLWASSRVMRAASARRAVLHDGKTDLDVDKYAAEPQEEYQIVVRSGDMAPFVRHDEKFFQINSYLEAKKSKQKLYPSHVGYDRDANGQMVTTAVFFFPKKTTSGDPTIAPDEKSLEFNCKLEGTDLRVNFEPQKMQDNQGPAL